MSYPGAEDYLHCFSLYGDDIRTMYLDHDEGRYEFLFERILRMLIQQSSFNTKIPLPFKITARKILSGDPEARSYMSDPEKRNFMLSDLYDFVLLQHKINQRNM
ncbi:MAG: hypothetical protein HWE30_09145 [Methylocystaceae bacterium]|nr:hypothetical protein [Methylocystaceae bacterium]